MEEISSFLMIDEFIDGDGSGSGYGYGDGDGDGSGYGYGGGSGDGDGGGSGDGSGYGYGYGYGGGSGDGSGSGYGYGGGSGDGLNILRINDHKIYYIDNIPTLINLVHGNYANGKILNDDLSTLDCFIAKCGNFFAHGKTLKQALHDAQEKYDENMSAEQRIEKFNLQFPDDNALVDGNKLFSWHHILTGSCLFGRQQFCREHGLDINAKYTIKQFISLTENSFGGDMIGKLKKSRRMI